MGAWIETDEMRKACIEVASHPTWVRGLKLTIDINSPSIGKSHPTWVRGLKLLEDNISVR